MSPTEPEEGDDHLALVARIKAVQRDSDQGRNQWHNFCDTSGKGTRDPSRHPASFLRSFFEALRDGSIPQGLEALHERPLPENNDDPKEALPILVAKVKQGQRTSVEFKQRWWNYADTQHDGIRDPSKHDVASLRRFLSDIAPGTLPSSGGSADAPPQLAERVKQMQRQSEQVKQQWWWYCDTFGAGVRDPARHQEAFLQQFLSMCEAQQVSAASAAGYGKALDASAYRYSPYDQNYAAAAAAAAQAYGCAGYTTQAYGCAGYAGSAYAAPGYPAQAYSSQGYTTPAAAYGATPAAYGTPPSAAYAAAYPGAYAAYPLPGAPGAAVQPGVQPGAAGMQPAVQPALQPAVQAALPMYGAAPPAMGTALPGVGPQGAPVAGMAPAVGTAYVAQTAGVSGHGQLWGSGLSRRPEDGRGDA
mmetsp:Transcript_71037/g.219639  ORF Transcript_71037/g.219639 Transcript_71037/m.219639 type:complete len:417 (-) Transcript_71037:110-1360(-)